MLSSIIAGGLADDDPSSFHVAGMQDLPEERSAHIYWVHETPLAVGDRLSFTLVECGEPSLPIEAKATDSIEYLEEQREFEEFEKNFTGPERPSNNRWPNLELILKLKDEPAVRARPLDGEKHIMCTVHWDKWRPERCRVYVRSFADGEHGTSLKTTDWLRGVVHVGDTFEISVHA